MKRYIFVSFVVFVWCQGYLRNDMSIFRLLKIGTAGDGPDCECGISETTAKLIRTEGQQRASIPECYLTPWKLNESFPDKKGPLSLSSSFSICRQSDLYPIYRQWLHVDCRCPWQGTRKFRNRTGLCQPGGRWDDNRLPHHTPVARYFEQTTRQERTSTR